MPLSLSKMGDILLHGLRMTPIERDKAQAEADMIMKVKVAKERAYYESLGDADREDYDRLTEGMMPRLKPRR